MHIGIMLGSTKTTMAVRGVPHMYVQVQIITKTHLFLLNGHSLPSHEQYHSVTVP